MSDIYDEVDWAGILRHAAASLDDEGRHNQGDILKQAAQHIDHRNEELAALRATVERLATKASLVTDAHSLLQDMLILQSKIVRAITSLEGVR